MTALRAVRFIERDLGLFPEFHAVAVVYISFGHKNMPLIVATSFSRPMILTVQI